VEDKAELMRKLGKKQLRIQLTDQLEQVPASLESFHLEPGEGGRELIFTYDTKASRTGITTLLAALGKAGIGFNDLSTSQSSLEQIFVSLVRGKR
jgi:ABC-2 type transport system ATP-binding protein